LAAGDAQSELEREIARLRDEEGRLWEELGQQIADLHAVVAEVKRTAIAMHLTVPGAVDRGHRIAQRAILIWLWLAGLIVVGLGLAVVLAFMLLR
jgi:hypothetical protein